MARDRGPNVPAVFRTLGLLFHQGIDRTVETEDELVLRSVGGFCDETRPVLRVYLDEIVRSVPDDELVRLWNAACPDWHARDGRELRRMLGMIRDKLGQGRTSPGWHPVGTGHNHGRRVSRPSRAKGRRAASAGSLRATAV